MSFLRWLIIILAVLGGGGHTPAYSADIEALESARQSFVAGDFQEVEKTLTIWLQESPFSVEGRLLLADALIEQKKYEPARVEIDRAFALRPQHAQIFELKAKLSFEQNQLQEAIKWGTTAVQKYPATEMGRLYRAKSQMAQGHYADAIADIRDLVADKPLELNYYNLYAESKLRAGQGPEAEKILKTALKINSRKPTDLSVTYFLMGELLSEKGLSPQAVQAYQKSLQLNPSNVDSSIRLFKLFAKLGDHQKSEAEINRQMENSPTHDRLAREIYAHYQSQERLDQAALHLKRLLERDPSLIWALEEHAGIVGRLGRPELSEKYLSAAIASPQSGPEIFIVVAKIYHSQKIPEKALKVLSAAEARFPDHDYVKYNLGLQLALAEKWAEAAEKYGAVSRESPLYVKAVMNMAYALEKKGAYSDAVALLKSASTDSKVRSAAETKIRELSRLLAKSTQKQTNPPSREPASVGPPIRAGSSP